ncbi:MAG: hypothetical protein K2N71_00700 [Oscillospiraceae bacterium]|nr:hypothetical protein [Oscillospiraceae bacterium]
MNGVKGLILKEIYLRRKSMLAGLAILIPMFILAVSFCLSFDYGNMKNNEELDRDTTAVILAYTVAGVGIILFGQNAETIVKDKKCKWNIFEHTLPMSAQKLAAVRIGLLLASSILGLVVSTLLSWVIFALSHKEFTLTVFANISVISMFVFALMTFANFMNLKYSDPQKAATRSMAWLFAVYILIAVFVYRKFAELQLQFSELTEDELNELLFDEYLTPLAEFRDKLFPFFIFIFAAIAVIGYFLFLTQYKRREK